MPNPYESGGFPEGGDPFDILLLEADKCRFQRSKGGLLWLSCDGRDHEEILVFRTFPFSEPDRYISIRTKEGEEIGIIADLRQLDDASRQELENELHLRYLLPRVEAIRSIKQKTSGWQWDIVTQFGPERLQLPNLHDHVFRQGEDRLLLVDTGDRRLEVASIRKLDPASLKQLQKIF
ncbi:DUF1854 domain-containing protein [Paenibacillus chitinolyticus]|uniref:DUF1854 domain-containing protein n=1 Tax=Paenibacillus chitinolyticus TaxID=79263 RepID=UPI002DBD932E|nr:DUF1854 domain-containing protein [Paenibacillus chitinolyticus]MEC0244796.1 DUF1854 domain-containing protein [Paenibacillus chitinolyticus]